MAATAPFPHDPPSPCTTAGTEPLALVAAVAANGVIGAGLAIPWRLPADLRYFRSLTTGHAIIMGRRTWQSLPHALPGRQNIVVSSATTLVATGAEVVSTLAAALAAVRLVGPRFVIGGAMLYAAALPLAQHLYLTEIARDYPGDVSFPAFAREAWQEASRVVFAPTADVPGYAFVRYDRHA